MISHMVSNKKEKSPQKKRSDLWLTEGELDEGGQNIETPGYKTNKY